jgi:hypothetical protein
MLIAVSFAACKGDDGPMGPAGPAGEGGVISYPIPVEFIIEKDEWELEGTPGDPNSYLYVDRRFDDLTEDVFYDGIVVDYMATKTDQNKYPTVKQKLPYTEAFTEGGQTYTRKFESDYEVGWVRFKLKYSDLRDKVETNLETQYFYVVILY